MDRGDLSVRIQILRLGRGEEHESFVAREEAIDVIVKVVMLIQMVSQHPRERHSPTSPEEAPFFDLPSHRFTC